MSIYYNEIDPFCCDWLRQLIKRGLLPDGEIDNRSIEDVRPDDLREFSQCHFFAGIGGHPYALRLAGWSDDRPVWTGSCPCQPFSTAGKRKGISDERHLWPSFFWLISQCRPDTIIGEQIASKDALAWWDIVHTDLEGAGYACGVSDTCAAGFGAPHIRQRLYWVAVAEQFGWRRRDNGDTSGVCREIQTAGRGSAGGLAFSMQQREFQQTGNNSREESPLQRNGDTAGRNESAITNCSHGGVDNAVNERLERHTGDDGADSGEDSVGYAAEAGESCGSMPTNGFWTNPDWLWCRDKKWRPVKPGSSPLVDGVSEGMGSRRDVRAIRQRLKGYGNAIVIPQAVDFIKAVMELINA